MGGHGGLNILPQKSWNVYGRKNRLRVYRDEEKEREKQSVSQKRNEKEEFTFKREKLLTRRNIKNIDNKNTTEALKNPEAERERREIELKLGRKDDRTSDPKFDASFAFAHNIKDAQPWYLKKPEDKFDASKSYFNNVKKVLINTSTEPDKKEIDKKLKKKDGSVKKKRHHKSKKRDRERKKDKIKHKKKKLMENYRD